MNTLSYDPGETAMRLRDRSIIESAKLDIPAETIARSWREQGVHMTAKRVRQIVIDDLAVEIGLENDLPIDPRD